MRRDILEKLSEITPEEARILQGEPLDMTEYNYTGERVMDPGQLLPRGELFGIRPHTRFVDFPRHSHKYVEMVYQIRGETEHILGGVTGLRLEAGQLLLLGRGTEHEIRAAGRETIAVNFILIPAFFDDAAISLGGGNALSVFLKGNLTIRNPPAGHLLYDVAGVTMVENLLENLILGQLEGIELETQQLTLKLLLRHLSRMSEKLVVETREEQERAVVLEVLARMESQVRVNLSEMAREMGLQVSTLSRMIRTYTGCTFTELLQTARFNRAATLLRETRLSVVDIAAGVGYENTAFFYRKFAERYGCTPVEYRRQYQS